MDEAHERWQALGVDGPQGQGKAGAAAPATPEDAKDPEAS